MTETESNEDFIERMGVVGPAYAGHEDYGRLLALARRGAAIPDEATRLNRNIEALLDLDKRGALSPHGIGGLARELLTKCHAMIATALKEKPNDRT
jgi:hypothetical protein